MKKNLPVRVGIRRYDGSRTGLRLEIQDERSRTYITIVDIPRESGLDLLTGRDVEGVAEFVSDNPNIGRWHQNKVVPVPVECGYDDPAGLQLVYDAAERIANAGIALPLDAWVADRRETHYNHHKLHGRGESKTYEVVVRRWVGEAPAAEQLARSADALSDLAAKLRPHVKPVGPEPQRKKGRK